MHFYLAHSGAFTCFTATTLYIERETSRFETPHLGSGQFRKQIADGIEEFDVGTGIASWRAADGLLIDVNHLVDVLHASDFCAFTHLMVGTEKMVVQIW